jgi:hypothetical protein
MEHTRKINADLNHMTGHLASKSIVEFVVRHYYKNKKK